MPRSRVEGAFAPAGSRTEPEPQLTDEHWCLVEDLFRAPQPSPQGGRPRAMSRNCLEGILWVLRTGARWKDVPRCFGSSSTCWRRFREWTESDVLRKAWSRLLHRLDGLGQINWEESMADGTFASAKKGVNP
jgi:transposase